VIRSSAIRSSDPLSFYPLTLPAVFPQSNNEFPKLQFPIPYVLIQIVTKIKAVLNKNSFNSF
jgi:hypothetical protein